MARAGRAQRGEKMRHSGEAFLLRRLFGSHSHSRHGKHRIRVVVIHDTDSRHHPQTCMPNWTSPWPAMQLCRQGALMARVLDVRPVCEAVGFDVETRPIRVRCPGERNVEEAWRIESSSRAGGAGRFFRRIVNSD